MWWNRLMRFTHLLGFIPLMLVEMWVVTCNSGHGRSPEEMDLKLNGTGYRCSGWLEVFHAATWKRIDSRNFTQQNAELACRELGCHLPFGILQPYVEDSEKHETCLMICQRNETALKDCIACDSHDFVSLSVFLVCQAPVQITTTLQPTTAPMMTSSKPFGQVLKSHKSSSETVLGILLGLVLIVVLLIICALPIYKKIMKKYSKNRQQQWIGPSGMNQNVSFHRKTSTSFQTHLENPVVQEEGNKTSQKTYLSPYAALEGATNRSSSPLDNSSDSDYDLCSAQQL